MISLGLSRITKLLQALRSPHCKTPIVHIAGTNGKGSVSAYLASILHSANLRVGRFNSPHLVDEWDCIRLREDVVEEHLFRTAKHEVEEVNRHAALEATPFEILTATAFSLFARSNLDVAIVEVGMGGEGDATNVVPASQTLLSILTAVDLDHQGFLGDTVGAIAKVKSGIVREGGDLVISSQAYPEVVEVAKAVASSRNARTWQSGSARYAQEGETSSANTPRQAHIPLVPVACCPEVDPTRTSHSNSPGTITATLPLPGSYQLDNSATAALAAQLLRSIPRTIRAVPQLATLTDGAIRDGLERTRWDGRLQWVEYPRKRRRSTVNADALNHRVLLDGAHNPSSAALLASYLSSLPPSEKPTTLVFGLTAPRSASEVLGPLLQPSTGITKITCVEFSPPVGMPWVRATPASDLHRAVSDMGVAGVTIENCEDVEGAFTIGFASQDQSILVAGSLYLVADALRLFRGPMIS